MIGVAGNFSLVFLALLDLIKLSREGIVQINRLRL